MAFVGERGPNALVGPLRSGVYYFFFRCAIRGWAPVFLLCPAFGFLLDSRNPSSGDLRAKRRTLSAICPLRLFPAGHP